MLSQVTVAFFAFGPGFLPEIIMGAIIQPRLMPFLPRQQLEFAR
jgi:hypothetical protein